MSLRVCAYTRCPKLVQPNERYCNEHKRLTSKARGTTTQRGYGHQHQKLRHEWEQRMAHGAQPTCPRCHQPIRSGQPWQLDHNSQRTGWLGPSHTRCNEQAGQANSTRMREHWQRRTQHANQTNTTTPTTQTHTKQNKNTTPKQTKPNTQHQQHPPHDPQNPNI